jgi:hypothetical protein
MASMAANGCHRKLVIARRFWSDVDVDVAVNVNAKHKGTRRGKLLVATGRYEYEYSIIATCVVWAYGRVKYIT